MAENMNQARSFRDRAGQAISELRAMAARLASDTTELAKTVETRTDKLAGQVTRAVDREPIGTAAALFATGFAIGYVFWLINRPPAPPRRRRR